MEDIQQPKSKSLSLRNFVPVIFSALWLYLSLTGGQCPFWDAKWPVSLPVQIGLLAVGLVLLVLTLYRTSYAFFLFLVALFVPFEFSAVLPHLPSLSPIDLFTAAAALALLLDLGPRRIFTSVRAAFPATAAFALGGFLVYGLFDCYWRGGNIAGILRWGEFLFAYCVAFMAYEDYGPRLIHNFAKLQVGMMAILSFVAVAQFLISKGDHTQVYALFRQHNIFAAYISLTIPAAWFALRPDDLETRLWRSFVFLVSIAAFILAYSRGAWASLLLSTALMMFLIPLRIFEMNRPIKGWFWSILLLVVLGGALFVISKTQRMAFTLSARQYYWEATRDVLADKPFLGLGPKNYSRDIGNYLSGRSKEIYRSDLVMRGRLDFWQHLHSVYLQLLVEYGLIGFALWFAGIMSLIVRAIRNVRLESIRSDKWVLKAFFIVSILSFCFHNLVDYLFVHSLDLLFAFLLGFCVLKDDRTEKSR